MLQSVTLLGSKMPIASVLLSLISLVAGQLLDPSPAANEVFNSQKVRFYLSRLNYPEQELVNGNENSVASSRFDPKQPTVVFIHGYQGNHLGAVAQTVKNAFLTASNANVILVDYQFYNSPYMRLYGFYMNIGQTTADMIKFLMKTGGLSLPNLTIVGHSFGAQISAITANNIGPGVERIIGLDPAGPIFRDIGPENRLSPDDADYVGCIHTSPVLGISESICQVNYFVNGGQLQPSCSNAGDSEILFGTCSHNTPMSYLADVLKDPQSYPAAVCISTYDAKKNKICSRAAGGYMDFPLSPRPYLPGTYYVAVPSENN